MSGSLYSLCIINESALFKNGKILKKDRFPLCNMFTKVAFIITDFDQELIELKATDTPFCK